MVTLSIVAAYVLMLTTEAPDPPPLTLNCWVIQASTEGRNTKTYDKAAAQIKDVLEDLPFDSYQTLQEFKETIAQNENKRYPLTPRYTLNLLYAGRDESGRARVVVSVFLATPDSQEASRTAVETKLLLAEGGKARVGGLREGKGELIIVAARP